MRFRSGYATADIGRIGTQQDFLMSVASQMLTLGNIPNLPTFIDIFVNNVDTNLSAENLAFFARQFLMCNSENIHFYTMPYYGDSVKGLSYVSINISEWLQMVNDSLNPYDQDVTEANVNILTHSFTSGFYSTSGYIAGGADSFYDNTCRLRLIKREKLPARRRGVFYLPMRLYMSVSAMPSRASSVSSTSMSPPFTCSAKKEFSSQA